MLSFASIVRRLGIAAVAVTAALAPLGAAAQDVPSYASPTYASTDETIHGRIRSVDGAFNITVDDDRGFVDNVELHAGTIINPTGLTLAAGMSVTIAGYNAGSAFNANEIDTPYTYGGPLPSPVYYGPGYWYPGFGYGYGPSFFVAVVIGGGGPWHCVQHPFYGRPWNGRAYFGATVGVVPAGYAATRVALNRTSVPSGHAPAPSAFAGRGSTGQVHDASQVGEWAGYSNHNSYTAAASEHEFSSTSTQRDAPGTSRGGERYVSNSGGSSHGGGSSHSGGGSGHSGAGHGGGHGH
jgi:hypothetical protein